MHEINGGDGPGPEVKTCSTFLIFHPFPEHLGVLAHIRPVGDWSNPRKSLGRDNDQTLRPYNALPLEAQMVPLPEMVRDTLCSNIILNMIGGELLNLDLLRRH